MPRFMYGVERPHKMSTFIGSSTGGNNLAARVYGQPGRQGGASAAPLGGGSSAATEGDAQAQPGQGAGPMNMARMGGGGGGGPMDMDS